MPSLPNRLLGILLLFLLPLVVQARKVQSRVVKPVLPALHADSICEIKDSTLLLQRITLRGYEKTRDATQESLFATNNAAKTLTLLCLAIEYRDEKGRQLHRREVRIPCEIPTGETRLLNFPSWDKQHTFYYRHSPAPKRAQASPYDVKIERVSARWE